MDQQFFPGRELALGTDAEMIREQGANHIGLAVFLGGGPFGFEVGDGFSTSAEFCAVAGRATRVQSSVRATRTMTPTVAELLARKQRPRLSRIFALA